MTDTEGEHALDLSTSPKPSPISRTPSESQVPSVPEPPSSTYDSMSPDKNDNDISSLTAKVNPIMGTLPSSSMNGNNMDPQLGNFDIPGMYPTMMGLQQAHVAAALAASSMPMRNSMGFPGMVDPRMSSAYMGMGSMQNSLGSLLNAVNNPLKRKRATPQSKKVEDPIDKKANTTTVPEEKKDDAYWERRKKNNEAAKRSRDSRRQKENEVAVKAMLLEGQNLQLKAEVSVLKDQLSELQCRLLNKGHMDRGG